MGSERAAYVEIETTQDRDFGEVVSCLGSYSITKCFLSVLVYGEYCALVPTGLHKSLAGRFRLKISNFVIIYNFNKKCRAYVYNVPHVFDVPVARILIRAITTHTHTHTHTYQWLKQWLKRASRL